MKVSGVRQWRVRFEAVEAAADAAVPDIAADLDAQAADQVRASRLEFGGEFVAVLGAQSARRNLLGASPRRARSRSRSAHGASPTSRRTALIILEDADVIARLLGRRRCAATMRTFASSSLPLVKLPRNSCFESLRASLLSFMVALDSELSGEFAAWPLPRDAAGLRGQNLAGDLRGGVDDQAADFLLQLGQASFRARRSSPRAPSR